MGARVIGIGTALPDQVVTNDDLAQMMDTSDQWIRERTGIHERRIGMPTSTLGIKSGRTAMAMAGVSPNEIELLILSTSTPDQLMPGTAAAISEGLALGSCGIFDLNAACAGFTYGFVVASCILNAQSAQSGSAQSTQSTQSGSKKVLLIGADSLSPVTDWTDRGTAILFSDGGGAVVLEHTYEDTLLGWNLGSNAKHRDILYCDHGSHIKMEGREVFKVAVRAVSDSILQALDQAGISPDDVDVLLPHQANIRIIEAICKRTNIDMNKSHNVISYTGNNSSATIPLSMWQAYESGALKPGSIVVMTGFGAGMTWATAVVRW